MGDVVPQKVEAERCKIIWPIQRMWTYLFNPTSLCLGTTSPMYMVFKRAAYLNSLTLHLDPRMSHQEKL